MVNPERKQATTGNNSQLAPSLLQEWQEKIELANRHNIFCYCRHCTAEWVDSSWEVTCPHCGSLEVEQLSCWQFPDD